MTITQHRVNMVPDKSLMIKIGQKNYKIPEALAELVDNSVDAQVPSEKLVVDIKIDFMGNKHKKSSITIEDNGTGMDQETFENATILGRSSKIKKLGMYGLGLKTSCMNLGKRFVIESTQKGSTEKYVFVFDEDEWMKNKDLTWADYPYTSEYVAEETHYTKIIIEDLRINKVHARRTENRVMEDFGLRYGMLIESGDIIVRINGLQIKPNFPSSEDASRVTFDVEVEEGNPDTRVYGWVGLRWDSIREKVVGSQKGDYGFITFRNKRLITVWDDLKVDKETFALRRHPTWATIVGVVHLDCIPVDNDKRNFIQESPLYVEAVKKIRPFVKQVEEVIKSREDHSEIAEDIKEITDEIVHAAEKSLEEKDIQSLIEDNATEEGLDNYAKIVKKNVAGREIRTDQIIEDDKEFRESVKSVVGSIAPKETGKIRNPSSKVQRGKTRQKDVVEDPEGVLDIDVDDEKMKVAHQYVQNIEGESLRAWELRSDGLFIVKTNIGPIHDLTGKEYPTFALLNICESLAEYCLSTKETSTIVQVRDELIKKVYKLISEIA